MQDFIANTYKALTNDYIHVRLLVVVQSRITLYACIDGNTIFHVYTNTKEANERPIVMID